MSLLPRLRFTHGFSLLELSLVIGVMSIMMGGMLNIMAQSTTEKKQEELKMKMDAIEAALKSFRKANGRLPCPADGTYLVSNALYGLEGQGAGSCTTGASYSSGSRTADASPPTANFSSSSNVVGGVLPVRTLGLPDDYSMDPWGGRFTYVIDKRISANGSFSSLSSLTASMGQNTLKTSAGGNAIPGYWVALLISHGPNGHGAFQLSGVRKSSGITNPDELMNCHCDASAANTGFNANFVRHSESGTGLAAFDDIVRSYTRASFLSANDQLTDK